MSDRVWRVIVMTSIVMMLSPFGYLGCHEMTLRDACLPGKKVRSQESSRGSLVVCRSPHSGKEWIKRID